MAGIRLEFAQFGDFDSFEIIRSMTSMVSVADVDLPTPIATGLKTMYYVDTTVITGSVHYYKVRVWRGGVSFVSSEIEAYAFDNSLFVLHSDFLTDMVDKTGKIWTAHGDAKVSTGALMLDGSGDYLTTPASNDYHFNNSEDVTIRFKVKINSFKASNIATVFSTYSPVVGDPNYSVRVYNSSIMLVMWSAQNPNWTYSIPLGTEKEISIERKNMIWRLYVDGVQIGSTFTQTSNYTKDVVTSYIGSAIYEGYSSDRDLNGTIRKFQIIKGLAVGNGGATTKRI